VEGGRLRQPDRGDDSFGVDTKDGIELAFDEVNATGARRAEGERRLRGRPDQHAGDREEVLQLIQKDKVVALIGR